MSRNLESLAMIDVAEIILKENNEPIKIKELIERVREIKGVSEDDYERITQLYMDITQSGKFVFCGDELWDLKERNLELWDKDGYAFVKFDDVEEEDVSEDEDDELEFTEFNIDDIEDEEDEEDEDEEEDDELLDKEELEEEKEYIDVSEPVKSTDDDDVDDDVDLEFDDDDYDEENYNEIMDDYEDMYDK